MGNVQWALGILIFTPDHVVLDRFFRPYFHFLCELAWQSSETYKTTIHSISSSLAAKGGQTDAGGDKKDPQAKKFGYFLVFFQIFFYTTKYCTFICRIFLKMSVFNCKHISKGGQCLTPLYKKGGWTQLPPPLFSPLWMLPLELRRKLLGGVKIPLGCAL